MLLISHQGRLAASVATRRACTHSCRPQDIYTKGYRMPAKRFSLLTSDENARLHVHKNVPARTATYTVDTVLAISTKLRLPRDTSSSAAILRAVPSSSGHARGLVLRLSRTRTPTRTDMYHVVHASRCCCLLVRPGTR